MARYLSLHTLVYNYILYISILISGQPCMQVGYGGWSWQLDYNPCQGSWAASAFWCLQEVPCPKCHNSWIFHDGTVSTSCSLGNRMHQFTTSFSSLAKPLSPADSNEMSLHNAARKVGLTFDCKITYLEIPICTGYDDDGLPIVEMKGWPFLLPSDMEPWVYSIFFAYPLAYHFFITKKYIYI